jgi:spore coat protein U-like protein
MLELRQKIKVTIMIDFIKYQFFFIKIILLFLIYIINNIILANPISQNINFSANVIAACTLTINDGINFGNYDITSADPVISQTTISMICTNETNYIIALDLGINSISSDQRRMKNNNGNYYLEYDIYKDAQMNNIWTSNQNTLTGTGTGTVQTINLYAKIRARQTSIAVGTYTDIVNLTVIY